MRAMTMEERCSYVYDASACYYRMASPSMAAFANSKAELNVDLMPMPIHRLLYDCGEVTKAYLRAVGVSRFRMMTDNETLEHMDLKKSTGYPRNLFDCQSKAEAFLWSWDDILDVRDVNFAQNIKLVFAVSEKTELRPIEKVDVNKLRSFQVASAAHSFWMTKIFGRFFDQLHAFGEKLGFYPGRSQFEGGWDRTVRAFLDNPLVKRMLLGDVSKWDRSSLMELDSIVMDVIWEFGDRSEFSRWLLNECASSVLHFPDGNFFIKLMGPSSGIVSTIDWNNIRHLVLFLYVFSRLTGLTPSEVLTTHSHDFCGDDSAYGTPFAVKADDVKLKYAEIGFLLKYLKEFDVTGPESMLDFEYLSKKTAMVANIHGKTAFVSYLDVGKALDSLRCHSSGHFVLFFVKLCSLMRECAWHPHVWVLEGMAQWCMMHAGFDWSTPDAREALMAYHSVDFCRMCHLPPGFDARLNSATWSRRWIFDEKNLGNLES